GDGTIRLDVLGSASIFDAAGNDLTADFTAGPVFTIDRTPPTATGITGDTYTKQATTDFIVQLSDPPGSLNGVDLSDFQLVAAGPFGASPRARTPVGSFFRAPVHTGRGDGPLRLQLIDNDSTTDLAGTPLGGAGAGNGSILNAPPVTVDRTPPTVLSVVRTG